MIFHHFGTEVRADDPNDQILQTTRDVSIGSMRLQKGAILKFNGRSVVFRPSGQPSPEDEETNDVPALRCALRRDWIKKLKKVPLNEPTKLKRLIDSLFKRPG